MHKASTIALAATTALFAFSGLAFAEETIQLSAETPRPAGIAPAPARNTIKTIQANLEEKRAELKDAAKDVRSNFKIEVKDVRTNTKQEMREATSAIERRAIEKSAIEQRKGLIETRKASSTEIRDQRKDAIEARKEKVSEIRDQKKERARQHIGKIEQRYAIVIRQFDGLVARIQSRIDKMTANGIDTANVESALALAQTAIAQVKTDAQALADLVKQVNSGDEAKALRAQIEVAVRTVNGSVKAAHEALGKAGKALIEGARTQKSDAPEPSSSGTPN
ncbi:MAG: hypothetical protein Q8Q13_01035 [bacterium]|nr:hypothetical protein [bacterium]